MARELADHRAQVRVGGAAAAQLGGNAGREDPAFLQRLVVVADERVGRVVIGRLGRERRSHFTNNRNEIRGLAHRSPLVGVVLSRCR